jgi:hypothetical protein
MTLQLMTLLLTGCLERVTGEAVPLDPRFVANQPGQAGAQGGGAGSDGGKIPFSDFEGEMVWVRGEIVAAEELPVDLDVRTLDATVEGGAISQGKLLLEGPGSFELKVPKALGELQLQAFQDPDSDGPSVDDAFGEVAVDVEGVDIEGLLLTLLPGARGGPEHVEAPPGAGGGQAPPPSGHAPPAHDPFEDMEGPFVIVAGTIEAQAGVVVDLDLFQPDPTVPGGRTFLGKIKRQPGAFEISVPESLGQVSLVAMVDIDADGPSGSDPQARFSGNPIDLSQGDFTEVLLQLSVGAAPAPAPVSTGTPDNLSLDEEFAATEEAAGSTDKPEAP